MRYATEYWKLIAIAVLLTVVLVFIAYRPQPEAPGDDTPLEHDLGAEPPPELRQP